MRCSCSDLVARELEHSLTHPVYSFYGGARSWREELEDEWPPSGAESERAFLDRMKRVYQRRHEQMNLPSPGTILDRDAAWLVAVTSLVRTSRRCRT